MKNEFGLYVKKLREEKNLNLSDVALESGISTSQISRIENGQRGIPKPATIQSLARGLKVPYEKLMEKAGYFKGLSEDKLQGVKDFFASHRELDERIELYIQAISEENKLCKDIFKSIEELIEKYLDEEEREEHDVIYTPSALKEVIRKADFPDDVKTNFVNDLERIVLNHINNKNTVPKSTEFVEIEELENYKFKFDGKPLSHDEILRLKELVLAGLKMLRG